MAHQLQLVGVPLPEAPKTPSRGYASPPGTGPKGQRCNTCRFCIVVTTEPPHVRKCEIIAARWDQPGTAIKHNAPACRDWQRKIYERHL
jgi:hypothetical protein